MAYLPDTGIILRMVNNQDPHYQTITQAVEKLAQMNEKIVIVPQVLVEFWTVVTRPVNVNGLGMTTEEAENALKNLQTAFILLPENERIFEEWKMLVVQYKVSGKTTHDARIAVAMYVHRISHILTLNPSDFKRYTNITAVTPQEILAETN